MREFHVSEERVERATGQTGISKILDNKMCGLWHENLPAQLSALTKDNSQLLCMDFYTET